jgi:uroporphyrinogen-III synthase
MLARVRAAGVTTFGFHPSAASPATVAMPPNSGRRPLAGRTVLVTRPRAQAEALCAALHEQGAVPVELPTIRIEAVPDPAPLDDALRRLSTGGYAWVVFTSVNAVTPVLSRLEHLGRNEADWSRVKVAAVGKATATALAQAGVTIDLLPQRFEAEAVVAALRARGVAGQRILYPKGDLAGETIARGLGEIGAEVDAIVAYRTVPEMEIAPALRERLERGEIDVVTFASPSSARSLQVMLGGRFRALASAVIACVGETTAAAVVDLGLPVHVRADEASGRGLVAALVRHYGERPAQGAVEAIAEIPAAGGNGQPERDAT